MKKRFILILVSVLFFGSFSYSQNIIKNKELQEFASDILNSNNKLRGKLIMIGPYKGDLSKLTYESYIKSLRENESYSDKGIATYIQKADRHVFISKKNSFLIAIYLKQFNAVLIDDATNDKIEYLKEFKQNERIPDLNELIVTNGLMDTQN